MFTINRICSSEVGGIWLLIPVWKVSEGWSRSFHFVGRGSGLSGVVTQAALSHEHVAKGRGRSRNGLPFRPW
jgi:hypothetical protein